MTQIRRVAHFVVTHPLGMHARVCSRWIKVIQKMRPSDLDYSQEWAWIEYQGEKISADSLFKLLETRVPCGAEFDLVLDEKCTYNMQISEELSYIISQQAFEPNI